MSMSSFMIFIMIVLLIFVYSVNGSILFIDVF